LGFHPARYPRHHPDRRALIPIALANAIELKDLKTLAQGRGEPQRMPPASRIDCPWPHLPQVSIYVRDSASAAFA